MNSLCYSACQISVVKNPTLKPPAIMLFSIPGCVSPHPCFAIRFTTCTPDSIGALFELARSQYKARVQQHRRSRPSRWELVGTFQGGPVRLGRGCGEGVVEGVVVEAPQFCRSSRAEPGLLLLGVPAGSATPSSCSTSWHALGLFLFFFCSSSCCADNLACWNFCKRIDWT